MNKFIILLAIFVALAANQVDASVDSNSTCVLKPIGEHSEPKLNSVNFNNCTIANFTSSIELGKLGKIELNDGVVNLNFSKCTPTESFLVVDFNCTQLMFHMKKEANFTTINAIGGFFNIINNGTTDHIAFSAEIPDKAFNVSSDDYYKCSTSQSLGIISGPKSTNGTLIIGNFAWETFRTPNTTTFQKQESLCSLDSQPGENDWVRIAVFICLVALVVIVLVAYFIGRRRWTERSSYESV